MRKKLVSITLLQKTMYNARARATLKMKWHFFIFSTLLIVSITHTSLAQIQTSKSIITSGTISYLPSPDAYFGVKPHYHSSAVAETYYPDLWTLIDYIGATHLVGAPRRNWIDEAANRGIKIMIEYGQAMTPETMMDAYKSKENLKAHLDKYNIPQYRNHLGVWAHDIVVEPFNNWDNETDNLVEVIKYGIQYIRSLDPTHPVTVSLNPAGAYYTGWTLPQNIIDKRKQWISRFIDSIDFLTYNFYALSKRGTWAAPGDEFWRDTTAYRGLLQQQFDQVLVPASKGKPIVIGETGVPTGEYTTPAGTVTFTEQQQADYFRIYGEESRDRSIFVSVFNLIDTLGATERYGLFNPQNNGKMNIPKVAASLVKNYLSIPHPP